MAAASEGTYCRPSRKIFDASSLAVFKRSQGCKAILEFVKMLADSVVGKTISDYANDESSPVMIQFVAFMGKLQDLVKSTPPLQQPMRFGNKAFRSWHTQLVAEVPVFLASIPSLPPGASIELGDYLTQAFGNETRIDYGTGHELFILIFFLLLARLGCIKPTSPCIVLQGFAAYMRTMRLLQETYLLEPAGSHGVWGLDDYHCLAFLFGAAQLVGHTAITPGSIHDLANLEAHHSDYLYLSCIRAIRQTKVGAPFSETSPMLHDISQLADWARVVAGLVRLFQGEVLFKLPVVQHIVFGSLLTMEPCEEATPAPAPVIPVPVPAPVIPVPVPVPITEVPETVLALPV